MMSDKDIQEYKLCGGKLDTSCVNKKSICSPLQNAYDQASSDGNISQFENQYCYTDNTRNFPSDIGEKCPEYCNINYKYSKIKNKCSLNNLQTDYSDNGRVFQKSGRKGWAYNSETQKYECEGKPCNFLLAHDIDINNIGNISTSKYDTNQWFKRILFYCGPIYICIKTSDPRSGTSMNNGDPKSIVDLPLLRDTRGNILNKVNHVVVIVGYGSITKDDSSTIDYWVVANSWGNDWKNNGYFAVKMTDKPSMIFNQMLFYKTSFVNGKINPRIKLTDSFLLADEHNNEEKIIFDNYGDFTYEKITQSTGANLEDDKSKEELSSFFEAISSTDESVDIPALPDLYSSNFGYYDSELNPWGHSFVSTIRDQGDCGSCWAFGFNFQLQVLSSLQYYFNTGKPKNIHTSTQNSVN